VNQAIDVLEKRETEKNYCKKLARTGPVSQESPEISKKFERGKKDRTTTIEIGNMRTLPGRGDGGAGVGHRPNVKKDARKRERKEPLL